MKKILIITNTIDLTTDYIINKYKEKIYFFRFNTDRFNDYIISVTPHETIIEYKDETKKIHLSKCDSLYYRKITLPDLSEYDPQYQPLMQREMLTVIEGIAETFGENAITRPSILRKADNKIVQMKIAQELGFNLPTSLITNSNLIADNLCLKNKVIVKPISFGKIMSADKVGFIQTNLVKNISDFNELDYSPAYFQAYVYKDYEIRLTIIENNFFGVRIDSTNKVDWRKEDAEIIYSKVEIPNIVKEKCLQMMKLLDLKFAAFDFIVSCGEYVFLELNANGQWLWLEKELDLKISNTLVSSLISENYE